MPDAMKQVRQWLAFRVTWNPADRALRQDAFELQGNVTNDHQGGESFATMLEYVKRNPNTVLGVYVRPPFIAIDLDGCVKMEIKDITPGLRDRSRNRFLYRTLSIRNRHSHHWAWHEAWEQEQNRKRGDVHGQACAHRHELPD